MSCEILTRCVGVSLMYPVKTLVRRRQVTETLQGGVVQSWRSLYKGLGSALVTQPSYWACYWPLYSWLSGRADSGLGQKHSFALGTMISFVSAGVGTVITNPLWMLRQRMQTEVVKGKCLSYTNWTKEPTLSLYSRISVWSQIRIIIQLTSKTRRRLGHIADTSSLEIKKGFS